jgi:hypothetical protein
VPNMKGAVHMGEELRFFSWSISGVVESESFSSRPGGILNDETLVAVVSGLVDLDDIATELTLLVDLRTTLADDRTIHVVGRHGDLLRQGLAGLNIAWSMSTLGMSMILRDLGSKERTNGCMKSSAVRDRSCNRVTAVSRSAQLSATAAWCVGLLLSKTLSIEFFFLSSSFTARSASLSLGGASESHFFSSTRSRLLSCAESGRKGPFQGFDHS